MYGMLYLDDKYTGKDYRTTSEAKVDSTYVCTSFGTFIKKDDIFISVRSKHFILKLFNTIKELQNYKDQLIEKDYLRNGDYNGFQC